MSAPDGRSTAFARRGATKVPVRVRDSFPLAMAKIALGAEALNYASANERYDRSGDERSRARAWKRLQSAALDFAQEVAKAEGKS